MFSSTWKYLAEKDFEESLKRMRAEREYFSKPGVIAKIRASEIEETKASAAWVRDVPEVITTDEFTWHRLNGELHREDGPARIRRYDDGTLFAEEYYKHGELHRENGPAGIRYGTDGKVNYEEYWINNKRHRCDGPAVVHHPRDGYPGVREEFWVEYWVNGERHREGGPAYLSHYITGEILKEEYWLRGVQHDKYCKIDHFLADTGYENIVCSSTSTNTSCKPAKINRNIVYSDNTNINNDTGNEDENKSETKKEVPTMTTADTTTSYRDRDGKLHNEDGPAYICQHANGTLHMKIYCKHGYAHREDGPAYVAYNEDGTVQEEVYSVDGMQNRYDWHGPAHTVHGEDAAGKYKCEEYWRAGLKHRYGGPASLRYNANGELIKEEYWLYGHQHKKQCKPFISDDKYLRIKCIDVTPCNFGSIWDKCEH